MYIYVCVCVRVCIYIYIYIYIYKCIPKGTGYLYTTPTEYRVDSMTPISRTATPVQLH